MYYKLPDNLISRKEQALFSITVFIIVLTAAVSVFQYVYYARMQTRSELMQEARMAAMAVNSERIVSLSGSSADLGNADYLRLKEQLGNIRRTDKKIRFIYLMGRNAGGAIFFYVDSEPAGYPDESPPGQVYTEASEHLKNVFISRKETLEGPYTDRWGTWMSAFVPIIEQKSNRLVAVLGMDVAADKWSLIIIRHIFIPTSLTAIILLVLIFSVWLLRANMAIRSRERGIVEAQRQYKELFEGSRDGFAVLSTKGEFLDANKAFCDMLGYADFQELKLKRDINHITPERWNKWVKEDIWEKKLLKSGYSGVFEKEYIRKDGTVFPVEVQAYGVFDEAHNPLYVWGITRDISERKKIEAELHKSQAQLLNAVKIARLGPWEYDVVNDVFTFNDSFYAVFRTTAKEVGGYTMPGAEYARRFMYPEDAGLVVEETRKAIQTKDPDFSRQLEHRIRYADGTPGYITVSFFVVKDQHGRTIKTYGVNQDITERKEAEMEIACLAKFPSENPNPVIRVSRDKRVLYSNKAGLEILEGWGISLGGRVSGRWDELITEAYETGILTEIEEGIGGRMFHFEIAPVTEYGYVNLYAKDVTMLKEKETELKKAYEKLQETQAQLIQTSKMSALGQLASGVAHEINNPLTGVLNNAQLIKIQMGQGQMLSAEELRSILDVIESSALRCKKITQSLLDFSHSAGVSMSQVSMNEVIEKTADIILNELKLQNISVVKELEAGLPAVSGNFQLLQQAVFGLISNAKWAIDKKGQGKGGTIIIRAWSEREKKSVVFSVSDDGIGISPENKEKLFEPFFTTKDVGEGTGLGLALIYNIIKNHKGSISVDSTVGAGTSFTVSIPAVS